MWLSRAKTVVRADRGAGGCGTKMWHKVTGKLQKSKFPGNINQIYSLV